VLREEGPPEVLLDNATIILGEGTPAAGPGPQVSPGASVASGRLPTGCGCQSGVTSIGLGVVLVVLLGRARRR
jgi:uncharacterized protein (TIGR03382 family)